MKKNRYSIILFVFMVINSKIQIFTQSSKEANQVQVPRYGLVYIYTNQNIPREVYFDRQLNTYNTNTNDISITNITNEFTIITIDNMPLYLNSKDYKKTLSGYTNTSDSQEWYRPKYSNAQKEARRKTGERRYIPSWDLDVDVKTQTNHKYPLVTNKSGTLKKGLWYDHYTGAYYTSPSKLQLEHIIAFHEAANMVGTNWTNAQKEGFVNSEKMSALLLVYKKENGTKSSYTNYLPPNIPFRPIFLDMRKHVIDSYNLEKYLK